MTGHTRRDADKAGLSPGTIVRRAIATANAEGLDAVTIRRLARELGVTPMALYWHFGNKDELLDAMAASVFDEIDLPMDATASWRRQLGAVLASLVAALRAHPAIAPLVATRTVSTEGSLRVTEVLLDALRRGGFSPAEATQIARHALVVATSLVAPMPGVVASAEPAGMADARYQARQALAALPAEQYPRLVEAAGPLSEGVAPDAYIAFGLDLLLAGIEAMAARAG
jgi:AcrR family transcriptional regulator